ncbi:MAG: DUF924 domain-containing protein [Rhizobium sp.]|nr:DUF924 domain-containing protein [Rhizobium sp.]
MEQRHDAIVTILQFWFEAGNEKNWFAPPAEFDDLIRRQFGPLVDNALAGDLDDWQDTAQGALALILLLDQFTRNLHRNSPRAHDGDPKARAVARISVVSGFDREWPLRERVFFYLPFGHSEDLADQDEAVRLAATLGNDMYLARARHYRDIIARFGRFPHRNDILGRQSTADERQFLDSGA